MSSTMRVVNAIDLAGEQRTGTSAEKDAQSILVYYAEWRPQIRRFGCTTRGLRELVTWLHELAVEHVAMCLLRFCDCSSRTQAVIEDLSTSSPQHREYKASISSLLCRGT
jgi:hypothetical protein